MARIEIGENVNRWLFYSSLLLIWGGSVLSSRFDCWGTILGGAAVAVLGCYLNLRSVKWVTERKTGKGGAYVKIEEGSHEQQG